jgi:hypothetical protein
MNSDERQNNLFLFSGASAVCSAVILGILFVIILQFSNIKQENVKMEKDLEEIKELVIKNNQTLELIKQNVKSQ